MSPITIETDVVDEFSEGQKRRKKISVPCGKCAACLSRRKDEWILRLKQEFRQSPRSVFVTLTYNDLSVPMSPEGMPSLRMADVSAFMKRLRKYEGTGVRFFGVGEYGSQFNRPHYHIILFNVSEDIGNNILRAWPFGFTQCSPLTEGRIAYTCKYVLGSTQFHEGVPFTFGSHGLSARGLLSDVALALQSALVSLPGLK